MKLRPFELTLVVIFGVMMVLALVLLRTYQPDPNEDQIALGGPVTIWGTLPAEGMVSILSQLADTQEAYRQTSYRYVKPENFDTTFVNALADGTAPDLLLIPHELVVKHRGRLETVPYASFPLRDFRNQYVDGAEIFALSDGVVAYPVAVDPLMMYWNRNTLAQENILAAPATWEDLVANAVPALTKRTPERQITQSAVALGEYTNVKNAFAIISLLALQGGSSLVLEEQGYYTVALDSRTDSQQSTPLTTAVTFYTNFNTVTNSLYSWNRNLPLDRDQFLAERLALYFGFGSEAKEIKDRNPNLNFDIAPVPQGQSATYKRTYGVFYGFAVPRAAKNKPGAYTAMFELSSVAQAKMIIDTYGLAPIHRSLLTAGNDDVYGRVIYDVVPTARGWLSPDKNRSNEIFSQMIEDVSANRSGVSQAVSDATIRLEQLY